MSDANHFVREIRTSAGDSTFANFEFSLRFGLFRISIFGFRIFLT